MAQNYYTVDKVIRGLLLKSGEDSEHKYGLYNLHACSFLEEFVNDSSREVRTVRLSMAPDRSVTLPVDYIDWAKVGTEHGDKVAAMSYNLDMNRLADKKPLYSSMLNYTDPEGNNCGELPCFGEFKDSGSFSVDYHRKIIRFNSNVNVQDVYVEYLSSKIDVCGETTVHPYAKQAMEYYIKWQEALFKKAPDVYNWEKQYWNERRKLNGRMSPFSLDMMHDIVSRNFTHNLR